jgi:hypothetical protein
MNDIKDERIKALEEACMNALDWFRRFGYNTYGIAVQDDIPDHEPIVKELKALLDIRKPKSN